MDNILPFQINAAVGAINGATGAAFIVDHYSSQVGNGKETIDIRLTRYAEVKPQLPRELLRGWLKINPEGNYNNDCNLGVQWIPAELLRDLKYAVDALESVGIKPAEYKYDENSEDWEND